MVLFLLLCLPQFLVSSLVYRSKEQVLLEHDILGQKNPPNLRTIWIHTCVQPASPTPATGEPHPLGLLPLCAICTLPWGKILWLHGRRGEDLELKASTWTYWSASIISYFDHTLSSQQITVPD